MIAPPRCPLPEDPFTTVDAAWDYVVVGALTFVLGIAAVIA